MSASEKSPEREAPHIPARAGPPLHPCKYLRQYHDVHCTHGCDHLCGLTPPTDAHCSLDAEVTTSEFLLGSDRFNGDFISATRGGPSPERWPLFHCLPMEMLGDIPAVPPVVTPAAASCTTQAGWQASAASLLAIPVSDYNVALPSSARAPSRTSEPTDRPSPGQPHTVFNDTCEIGFEEGGDWVRSFITNASSSPERRKHSYTRLDADGNPLKLTRSDENRCVRWTSVELYNQTQEWFISAASDKRNYMAARSPEEADAIRARTRTFIIPDHCHRGGGAFIWDLRQFRLEEANGRPTTDVPIPCIDVAQPIRPRLNPVTLRRRLEAAGVADEYGIQQLLDIGLMSQSEAPRHTVLQVNYPAVARHAQFAADLVRREAKEGILSDTFTTGIPLFPVRLNPFNAIEREGKPPRLCCDLSSPQGDKDGGGKDSINAGIPWSDKQIIADMRLTSAASFARDVGIFQALCPTSAQIWAATADWTAYYRQLAAPPSEYWCQLLWLDPEGPQLDLFTCFGDAAAPAQSNRCQDIFLTIIVHEFERRIALLRARTVGPGLQPFLDIEAAMAHRLAAIRQSYPDRCSVTGQSEPANRIWWRRQQRLAVVHGFFDDSLLSSFVLSVETDGNLTRARGPFEELIAALLTVAADIGLPVAAHKLDCGTPGGFTGRMDLKRWLERKEVWWDLHLGAMKALGKEVDLQSQSLRDTEKRVTDFLQEVDELCALANATMRQGRPTVYTDLMRAAIGRAMFIILTEPHLRSSLNLPLRTLKLIEAVAPSFEKHFRRARRDRHGLPILPTFVWAYFDVIAQEALRDMALGALLRKGIPFNPARGRLGADAERPLLYILQDASGSVGGGGGALYLDPTESCPPNPPPSPARLFGPPPRAEENAPGLLPAPAWSFDVFTPEEQSQHSTFQEGLNANRNLMRAAALGYQDIVEILDNSAWVFLARSGASSNPSLQTLLQERADFLASEPSIRVFSIWQARERGWLADALSKFRLPYPEAFPMSPGADDTERNSPSRLAASTLSGEEWAREAMIRLGFAPTDLLTEQTRIPLAIRDRV